MKASEFRSMSLDDLDAKILSLEENMFRLRCNKTIGQLDDTSVLRQSRKDISRAKTIHGELIRENKAKNEPSKSKK